MKMMKVGLKRNKNGCKKNKEDEGDLIKEEGSEYGKKKTQSNDITT
jgi:hypothetical protein